MVKNLENLSEDHKILIREQMNKETRQSFNATSQIQYERRLKEINRGQINGMKLTLKNLGQQKENLTNQLRILKNYNSENLLNQYLNRAFDNNIQLKLMNNYIQAKQEQISRTQQMLENVNTELGVRYGLLRKINNNTKQWGVN